MNFSAAPLRGEGILSADAFVIRPLAGRL